MSAHLKSRAHYDLMASFESTRPGRLDKEPKESWAREAIYQDGHVNELFLAYRRGHAYAQADARADIDTLHSALERLTAMYESEFDHENVSRWRPDWLVDALARTNSREQRHD